MVNRKGMLTTIIANIVVLGGILGLENLKSRVAERADSDKDRYIDQIEMRQLYQQIGLKVDDQQNLSFPGISYYRAIRYLNK